MYSLTFSYYRVIKQYRHSLTAYPPYPECVHVVFTQTKDGILNHPASQEGYVYRLCVSAGGNMGTAIPGLFPFTAWSFGRQAHPWYDETSLDLAYELAPQLVTYTEALQRDLVLLHETLDLFQTFLAYQEASIQRIQASHWTHEEFLHICQEPLEKIQTHPSTRALQMWLRFYTPS